MLLALCLLLVGGDADKDGGRNRFHGVWFVVVPQCQAYSNNQMIITIHTFSASFDLASLGSV
jgi:hypothetical protein